ncbi:MAG: V-type ATP synthase subunit D [Clostridiales bacterium]|jgi:V/A-type H+-transporting ATPase subunit D|nr:V-type ATP synthase subunit D [Clostridiales bacterium]
MVTRLNVNPTRMELRRLKTRLKTAMRGYKLLKDKSDEMIRRFMGYIRLNKALREELDGEIARALRAFMLARGMMMPEDAQSAVALPACALRIRAETENVMGLTVPKLAIGETAAGELYPYGFVSTNSELDNSISLLSKLMQKIVRLAEVEKVCNMLAAEIEKTRRRVNALEYVMIPQIKETIKFITMKLDENERGNLIRLMKVKAMIESQGE